MCSWTMCSVYLCNIYLQMNVWMNNVFSIIYNKVNTNTCVNEQCVQYIHETMCLQINVFMNKVFSIFESAHT